MRGARDVVVAGVDRDFRKVQLFKKLAKQGTDIRLGCQ
jgi:hypothetical protein